ncbi:heme oxygenase-like protein [Xylaria nigripes]|nr:heme oxygenase-like protein [Xylaria nigripes]
MSSTSVDPPQSLSDSMNNATRSIHAELNELVLSRLRLALPPQADDASQYVSGLIHIAPIYIAFESIWKAILESPESHDSEQDDQAGDSPEHQSLVSTRIRPLLAHLYIEGLQRSQALQKDLKSLTNWSDRTLAEQLNDASESPVLGGFLDHINSVVVELPHVLLSYAWVLYMALFSGGRIIWSWLEGIYPGFWIPASAQQPVPATLAGSSTMVADAQPLSFFRFDTAQNGEDLKQAFKERLVESEGVLTGPERDEIVREACRIFDFMVRIIDELDGICGTDKEVDEARLLSLRSRDSVVVEKERRLGIAKLGRKDTGASDSGSGSGSKKAGGEGHIKFC